MNNLIQKLNDKYLELDKLLMEFDELLGNAIDIDTVFEGELGREYGTIHTLSEDDFEYLRALYYKLEKIIGG